MTGRPINQSRQMAILMGDTTYEGLPHHACGTTVRYVKGGMCVRCARLIATEQREARRSLKALTTNPDADITELDAADEVAIDEATAEARFERSIDELM